MRGECGGGGGVWVGASFRAGVGVRGYGWERGKGVGFGDNLVSAQVVQIP